MLAGHGEPYFALDKPGATRKKKKKFFFCVRFTAKIFLHTFTNWNNVLHIVICVFKRLSEIQLSKYRTEARLWEHQLYPWSTHAAYIRWYLRTICARVKEKKHYTVHIKSTYELSPHVLIVFIVIIYHIYIYIIQRRIEGRAVVPSPPPGPLRVGRRPPPWANHYIFVPNLYKKF